MALTLSTDDFQSLARLQFGCTRAIWVASDGNDSNDGLSPAAAKLTLAAAKAAASAGDTIFVSPGTYDEKDLLKNGVNWRFAQGANVVYTGSANGGIFDDGATGANGAVTCRVSGFGTFSRQGTGSSKDAVRIANASSYLTIEASKVDSVARGIFNGGGLVVATIAWATATDGVVDAAGGRTHLAAHQIVAGSGFCLEVDNGADLFVSANLVRGSTSVGVIAVTDGHLVLNGATIVGRHTDEIVWTGVGATTDLNECRIINSAAAAVEIYNAGTSRTVGCAYDRSKVSSTVDDIIASAVRDIDNSSPAAGSLGEDVASSAAGVSVTITPLQATSTNPRYAVRDLAPIAQHSAPSEVWTITDAAGTAVNLSGKTIRLVVCSIDDAGEDEEAAIDDTLTGAWQYQTGGLGITIGGASSNQVTVQHSAANNGTVGSYRYFLWNVTDSIVLARGDFDIEPAVLSA